MFLPPAFTFLSVILFIEIGCFFNFHTKCKMDVCYLSMKFSEAALHSVAMKRSENLFCNFIEITLRHGCFPVNLLHIFRTPFPEKSCRALLLKFTYFKVMVSNQIRYFQTYFWALIML